jgi:ribosomal 50S subunit-recycling heat shock protein
LCDAGRIDVNGFVTKASKEIKVGDTIEIQRGTRRTTVRVLQIPTSKQVSKAGAGELIEIIKDEAAADDLLT